MSEIEDTFSKIDRLLSQVPTFKCPTCKTRNPEDLFVFYETTTTVPVKIIDLTMKRLRIDSDLEEHHGIKNPQVHCSVCDLQFPFPTGWDFDTI